jgi:membrane-associated phospholipid phosphatase/uncharacterized membrane protein YbhN (UPF0104 family)
MSNPEIDTPTPTGDSDRIPWLWYFGIPLISAGAGMLVWLMDLDLALFHSINALHTYASDNFWAGLTVLGDALFALPLTLIFLRYKPGVFAPMFVATLFSPFVLHSIKRITDIARPGAVLPSGDFHFVEPLYLSYSFPSGHSTMVFVWISIVILQMQGPTRRLWAPVLLGIGSVVAISRIMVGAHWPLDILIGAALGWTLALIATELARRWTWLHQPSGHRFVVGFFLVIALLSLFFVYTDYDSINGWHTGLVEFCILFAILPWLDRVIRAVTNQQIPTGFPRQALHHAHAHLYRLVRDGMQLGRVVSNRAYQSLRSGNPAWKWALHLAVLLGLVLLVTNTIGLGKLLAPWNEISQDHLLLAILLVLASYVIRALRLVFYFEEIAIQHSLRCVRLSVIHNLYNNLLPMRTGELSFPVLMAGAFDIDYRRSLSSLLWLRVLDLFAILTIGAISLFLVLRIELLAIVVALLGLTLPLWLANWIEWTSGGLLRSLPKLAQTLQTLRGGWPANRIQFWRAWGWTVLNWLVKLIAFAMVFQWFVEMPTTNALIAIVGAEASSVLPIHSIAGFGTYESGAWLGLSLLGEVTNNALAAAINLHLFILGMTIVSGLLALLFDARSLAFKPIALISRKNHV